MIGYYFLLGLTIGIVLALLSVGSLMMLAAMIRTNDDPEIYEPDYPANELELMDSRTKEIDDILLTEKELVEKHYKTYHQTEG